VKGIYCDRDRKEIVIVKKSEATQTEGKGNGVLEKVTGLSRGGVEEISTELRPLLADDSRSM
jgi:hypothetical protein